MKDKEFLAWLRDRLEHVHNENPNMDYMRRLRAIIEAMPEDAAASPSRCPEAAHPTPTGWRRLRTGQIIRKGDIMNALSNGGEFISIGENGFLLADRFADRKVESDDILAWYRKIK